LTNLVTDLGTFAYGSNPTFTITFPQNGTPTDPGGATGCKVTDALGTPSTPTLNHTGNGVYTFQVTGGLMVDGVWTGRAFAGVGPGQASVDFIFVVEPTRNP
jgi:hypothetical protein